MNANEKIVDEILPEIEYFAYMGLLDTQGVQVDPSDLNPNLNLELPDPEFFERESSIFNRQEIKNMPIPLVEVYQKLKWQPTFT